MQSIENLKLLGVSVLRLQLHQHKLQLQRILDVLHNKRISVSLHILAEQTNGEDVKHLKANFLFPAPELIPLELEPMLEAYANRLAGEKVQIEQAIDDLQFAKISPNQIN